MKEGQLKNDLEKLDFNPSDYRVSDYVFSLEPVSEEIKSFLITYEWLKSIGVPSKWCFTMRLKGHLAGVQILNEPTSYSKILGPDTMKYECLVQRGCTISWAHEHLGSNLLMKSIDWMVKNTDKRLFIGYADPQAGEVGIIYQACNFMYLGNNFGVKARYKNPDYRGGKEFCAHSLRRTGIFKWWCKQNGIALEKHWFKPNGFKDVKAIPKDILKNWYGWAEKLIEKSVMIPVDSKGKYALIKGKDKREQKYLKGLFNHKTYPYPKRD